jgi:hypothetical protein
MRLRSVTTAGRRPVNADGRACGRGQALVEMALLTPFLLLICLGCADLGRVFYTAVSLTNAVREAAKAASLSATNPSTLRSGYCEQPGLTWNFVVPASNPCDPSNWSSWTSSYSVAPAPPTANTGYISVAEDLAYPADVPTGSTNWSSTTPRQGGQLPVRVQIDYYWKPLTPIISNLLPNGVLHIHVASEQREQY